MWASKLIGIDFICEMIKKRSKKGSDIKEPVDIKWKINNKWGLFLFIYLFSLSSKLNGEQIETSVTPFISHLSPSSVENSQLSHIVLKVFDQTSVREFIKNSNIAIKIRPRWSHVNNCWIFNSRSQRPLFRFWMNRRDHN